jgi:hypothetical protein
VNLTARALPGFRVSPAGSEPKKASERQRESELLRCIRVASSEALAEENSKEFERESSVLAEEVKSEVTVAQSSDLATKALAATGGVAAPFHVDILGFVCGPAEVSLFTGSFPTRFSAPRKGRLLSLLLTRAKAHAV